MGKDEPLPIVILDEAGPVSPASYAYMLEQMDGYKIPSFSQDNPQGFPQWTGKLKKRNK